MVYKKVEKKKEPGPKPVCGIRAQNAITAFVWQRNAVGLFPGLEDLYTHLTSQRYFPEDELVRKSFGQWLRRAIKRGVFGNLQFKEMTRKGQHVYKVEQRDQRRDYSQQLIDEKNDFAAGRDYVIKAYGDEMKLVLKYRGGMCKVRISRDASSSSRRLRLFSSPRTASDETSLTNHPNSQGKKFYFGDKRYPPVQQKLADEEQAVIECLGFIHRYGLATRLLQLSEVPYRDINGQRFTKTGNFDYIGFEYLMRQLLPGLKEEMMAGVRKDPSIPAGANVRLVLVLDNAPWHCKDRFAAVAAEFGFELERNHPPYSSDLNPQEQVWRALKAKLQACWIETAKEAVLRMDLCYKELLREERAQGEKNKWAKMVQEMHKRAEECLSRDGEKTRW